MKAGGAALTGALLALVAIPWLLLTDRSRPRSPQKLPSLQSIVPAPAASIDAARARGFADDASLPLDDAISDTAPAAASDVPQISGIVGRLPDHAIALVKRPAGGTRTIGLGETIDGWRLESLSANAALFARDQQRVRVDLPKDPR